jgi:hypothetical protein
MYDTAKQAAKAYDAAAIEVGKPLSKLNFPKKVPPGYTVTQKDLVSTNTSGYRGVSNRKEGWHAQIRIEGKVTHLGYFNTLKQAAVAYDHAVHKHRLPKSQLNFPTMKHNLNKEPERKKQKVLSSTGFRGVEMSGERYHARLTVNCKRHSLGTFDTLDSMDMDFLNVTGGKDKESSRQTDSSRHSSDKIKEDGDHSATDTHSGSAAASVYYSLFHSKTSMYLYYYYYYIIILYPRLFTLSLFKSQHTIRPSQYTVESQFHSAHRSL